MDLSLTETQLMLQDSARRYLADVLPNDKRLELERSAAGHDPQMWKAMADMGWQGLLIPEKYGGSDRPISEMATLVQEMGKAALPSPFFETAVLCTEIIKEGASEAQKDALLPAIANGEKIVALAFTEPKWGWTAEHVKMAASRRNGRYRLEGTKLFVPWANVADTLLVVARTSETADPEDGITIFLVNRNSSGISWRPLTGFMGYKWAEVNFNGVEVGRANTIGGINGGWPVLAAALEKAIPILCAFEVGMMEWMFDMTVDYSRTRIQFGQPIGSFQRVADMIIEIVNRLDGARWLTYDALWKVETGEPEAAEAVSTAKAYTADNAVIASSWAHRLTAGTGVQVDFGLPSYTQLARILNGYLGDSKHHKKQLAKLLGV